MRDSNSDLYWYRAHSTDCHVIKVKPINVIYSVLSLRYLLSSECTDTCHVNVLRQTVLDLEECETYRIGTCTLISVVIRGIACIYDDDDNTIDIMLMLSVQLLINSSGYSMATSQSHGSVSLHVTNTLVLLFSYE
jgi:hypothetical protein